jgi:hypothetical protein
MNSHTPAPALMSELTADYREPSYALRLLQMVRGLRQPRASREYKAAVIEVQRLSAPLTALLLPLLAICLLLLMENDRKAQDRSFETVVLDAAPITLLTELEKPEIREVPKDELSNDINVPSPNVPFTSEAPDAVPAVTPKPLELPAVRPVTSICVLPGITGLSRSDGSRGDLLRLNSGDQTTEDAVMRALRWLKKNQQPDGSWKTQKIAMTGLATLTFLAHGEKPGVSSEFGETVQKALEYLMASQRADGRFNGMDGNEYAHPIATYALCEAYGMTLNPNVKRAAEQALTPILRGQHPTGGWDYRMDPNVSKENGRYRDDTSYMGWCAQALKAAKLAQLHADGLEKAMKLTVKGFRKNASPNGGFGYTAPGQGGLTGVGTLCLQLLGASATPEVKRSLELMDSWQPSFDAKNPLGSSPQYYFYYATQAKFHAGGKRWENWNNAMKPLYVNAQQVEKGAVQDAHGRVADIGWWGNGDAHTDRPVMDTCLAALQLMVYYRYLPTTRQSAVKPAAEIIATATDTDGDIKVETGNL